MPRPAPVAYPDLLAGVAAFAAATALLARAGPPDRAAEVSLLGAIEPLLDRVPTTARPGRGPSREAAGS